jgi:hypothetical protein
MNFGFTFDINIYIYIFFLLTSFNLTSRSAYNHHYHDHHLLLFIHTLDVYVVSNLILTACFVLNISIIPLRHSNLPSQFHHQLHFTSLYTNLANIRRLDDLEKAPIPEGYEEFASTGASSSTIQLRPIQRDENGLVC